jgi:hypothetical protein
MFHAALLVGVDVIIKEKPPRRKSGEGDAGQGKRRHKKSCDVFMYP